MFRRLIFLLVILSVHSKPWDYFRLGITYNDTESSYQPFYFNVTNAGDFFLRTLGATLTNIDQQATDAKSESKESETADVKSIVVGVELKNATVEPKLFTMEPKVILVTEENALHVTQGPSWIVDDNNI